MVELRESDRTGHDFPPRADRWVGLAVLSACMFLVGMDLTVLNVAAPTLSRLLLPSRVELLWILDAYSLAVAAFVVTCGTVGDRIGRKRMLLFGLAVFGIGSLGAAFAQSPLQLIVARAVLGVGAAAIMATAVAVIRVIFTSREDRTFAIGLWAAGHSVGAAGGPILGGFLVEHFWWGSVFLVNVPIVVASLFLAWRVIPESRDRAPRRWDPLSVVLSVAGVGGLLYWLKRLGGYGFETTACVVGLFALAALVAFIRRQRRLAQPLLDLSLFADRHFSVPVGCVLAGFGSTPAMLFLLTQKFQLLDGWSPLSAGLGLVPWTAASGIGGTVAPLLARHVGHRSAMTGGLGLFAASLAAVGLASSSAGHAIFEILLALAGLGLGVAMPLAGDTMMSAATAERAGEAAAVQEISFELGAALGIVVLDTFASITYRTLLPAISGVPTAAHDAAGESLGAAAAAAGGLPHRAAAALLAAARYAFMTGFRNAALLAAVVAAGTAVVSAYLLRGRHGGVNT